MKDEDRKKIEEIMSGMQCPLQVFPTKKLR